MSREWTYWDGFWNALVLIFLVAWIHHGCTAPKDGAERGDCYPNKTCNAGLVCASDVCVKDPLAPLYIDDFLEALEK